MRTLTVLAAVVMLLAGRLTVAHAGEGGDQDRIQGSWSVSTGEKAGNKAPAEGLKGVRVAFAGGKFTWKTGANETKGTFSLDATKTPGEISMMNEEGKTLAGVYRLEGDDLKICVGLGEDRPTDFATKAGAKAVLLVLKREKN